MTVPVLEVHGDSTPEIASSIPELARVAASLIEQATSPNTRKAYASDLRAWCSWCDSVGVSDADRAIPVAPEILAAWLSSMHQRGLAVATLRRRNSWMSRIHRRAGVKSPSSTTPIEDLLSGARRTSSAPRRVAPFTLSMARSAIPRLLEQRTGIRDRALLLVGLVTGFRRSELASLCWSQISESRHGRIVRMGRSKNHEAGRPVGIPRGSGSFCPVAALVALRSEAGDRELVFGVCSDTICKIVQRSAALAGEDPLRFGAHSLRSGFVTEASALGASLATIMSQSGHRSPAVAATYVRDLEADANPGAKLIVDSLSS